MEASQLNQEAASAASTTLTASAIENAPQVTATAATAIELPLIVAEWQKNARESIRISLSEYQGRAIVDCRQWYLGKDGELKPSPKGLTLALAHLPALASGIADALALACRHGLVEGGDQ